MVRRVAPLEQRFKVENVVSQSIAATKLSAAAEARPQRYHHPATVTVHTSSTRLTGSYVSGQNPCFEIRSENQSHKRCTIHQCYPANCMIH